MRYLIIISTKGSAFYLLTSHFISFVAYYLCIIEYTWCYKVGCLNKTNGILPLSDHKDVVARETI